MGVSPLGLPGNWSPRASLRYMGIANRASLIPATTSPMYKVIEQQTLGAMGGSRGYQTYTRHKVQVEQEDAKTKAQKSAAEQAADSDKPEEKPKSQVNITDQLLTESGWKMPEDKYAALHPTKAVDLMG